MAADSPGDDYERELAQWLEESGRRQEATTKAESPAELLTYLEDLTGRRLRSFESVRLFLQELSDEEAARRRSAAAKRSVREAVLVLLLAAAFAQYYYLDMLVQVESLQRVIYFVPATKAPSQRL